MSQFRGVQLRIPERSLIYKKCWALSLWKAGTSKEFQVGHLKIEIPRINGHFWKSWPMVFKWEHITVPFSSTVRIMAIKRSRILNKLFPCPTLEKERKQSNVVRLKSTSPSSQSQSNWTLSSWSTRDWAGEIHPLSQDEAYYKISVWIKCHLLVYPETASLTLALLIAHHKNPCSTLSVKITISHQT